MIKIELNALTRGGSTTRKYFLKKFDVYLRSHFKDLSDVHHEKRGRSHWYALKGIHVSFFFGAYFGAFTELFICLYSSVFFLSFCFSSLCLCNDNRCMPCSVLPCRCFGILCLTAGRPMTIEWSRKTARIMRPRPMETTKAR